MFADSLDGCRIRVLDDGSTSVELLRIGDLGSAKMQILATVQGIWVTEAERSMFRGPLKPKVCTVNDRTMISSLESGWLPRDGDVVQKADHGRVLTVVFASVDSPDGSMTCSFAPGIVDLRDESGSVQSYGFNEEVLELGRGEKLNHLPVNNHSSGLKVLYEGRWQRVHRSPQKDLSPESLVIDHKGRIVRIGEAKLDSVNSEVYAIVSESPHGSTAGP